MDGGEGSHTASERLVDGEWHVGCPTQLIISKPLIPGRSGGRVWSSYTGKGPVLDRARPEPPPASPSQVLACVNPHALVLPKEGMLKVHFVDLRPVPETTRCE